MNRQKRGLDPKGPVPVSRKPKKSRAVLDKEL